MSRKSAREDLVSKIEELTKGEGYYRSSLEQTWFINQINYMGFQWTYLDVDGTVEEIPNEVRFRANRIQPLLNHSIAKLTASPPEWDIDSDTDSARVQSAKNVGERWIEYVWDRNGMETKQRELASVARIKGTAFFMPEWDPNAGERITPDDIFPEGSNPADDLSAALEAFGDLKKAQEFLEGDLELYDGDVTVQVLDPFDVWVDESAGDESELRWCLVTQVVGVEDVKARWGKAAAKLRSEVIHDRSLGYKQRLRQLVSPNVYSGGASQYELRDSVVLHRYFERPTLDFKNGRMLVYANGEVLFYGENPYAHTSAEIPLVRYRDIPIEGRFWGQAAMEQAIPIQRSINKAYSNIIMNEHDSAQNKWLSPRGAGLKPEALDRSSNEVVEYNPVAIGSGAPVAPRRIEPGKVPELSLKLIELGEQQMMNIFGIHEVSQGQVPTGVSSGVALRVLKDADDTSHGLLKNEFEQGHARLGKMVLDIGKRFIKEPRTFRSIAGEEREAEVIDFMGIDLTYRNVRVEMGSKMNRIAKQQAGIEMLQYGGVELFDSMGSRKALFNAVGLSDAIMPQETVHEKRAKYENKQMQSGVPAYVAEYQDHAIHLQILEEWMNSLEFDKEPPLVQQMALQHRQEHMFFIQQAQMQQIQMMAMAQPSPSTTGGSADEGGQDGGAS